jgi:hypothetical protein
VLAAVAVLLFFAWLRSHDAWKNMEGDLKADAVKIKQNEAVGKAADTTITKATASNATIDKNTKARLDALQAQLNTKLNTDQAKGLVQNMLPGVQTVAAKDAQGNDVIAVADTQANRDALNQADVNFKSCVFNRDDCLAKQKNFLDIIAADNQKIGERDATINTLKEDNKKLKSFGLGGSVFKRTLRVAVPIACAGGGAYLAGRFRSGQQNQGEAAATGAVVGGTGCALMFHF